MILIVTNQEDLTADLVVLALRGRRTPFARLNTEACVEVATATVAVSQSSLRGSITIGSTTIGRDEIKAVYYRRPKPPRAPAGLHRGAADFVSRETRALLFTFLESCQARWVDRPRLISRAQNRVLQLTTAAQLGLTVPATILTSDISEAREFSEQHPAGVVAKTIHSPTLDTRCGLKRQIYTTKLVGELRHAGDLRSSPMIFQEFVDKVLDIRVTVVGSSVFPIEIDARADPDVDIDWRSGTISRQSHRPHALPDGISRACVSMTRQMGLSFAALDFCLDRRGRYVFLELNPNGEWAWVQTVAGLPVAEAICDQLVRAPKARTRNNEFRVGEVSRFVEPGARNGDDDW